MPGGGKRGGQEFAQALKLVTELFLTHDGHTCNAHTHICSETHAVKHAFCLLRSQDGKAVNTETLGTLNVRSVCLCRGGSDSGLGPASWGENILFQ